MGFLERFDTAWLRLSAKVATRRPGPREIEKRQRVFCGHTHEALSLKRDGVEYYNSGSWTQEIRPTSQIDHQGVRVMGIKQDRGRVARAQARKRRSGFGKLLAE